VNEVKDHSLAHLRSQLAESRALFGERLGLYQIHSATSESGVLEDRAVLDELRRMKSELRDDPRMNEPLTFDRFLSLPRLVGPEAFPRWGASRGGGESRRARRQGYEDRALAGRSGRQGEAAPDHSLRGGRIGRECFMRDGSLLFTSTRPDPDVKADPDHKVNALWLLPAQGGEARLLLAPDGGVDGVVVARNADEVAFGAYLHPEAKDSGR
jgi:hypothetical protein